MSWRLWPRTPLLYWATIIATTTVGTTLADYATGSIGIGYAGVSALLLILLLVSMRVWYRDLGTLAIDSVSSPRAESYYWATIMFSQTLGTALGDWTANSAGLGYGGAALIFASLLAMLAAAFFWTSVSRTMLFWAAFVLTRPLGAAVGDFLDKPTDAGGLGFSRYVASTLLMAFILACIVIFRHRPAESAH